MKSEFRILGQSLKGALVLKPIKKQAVDYGKVKGSGIERGEEKEAWEWAISKSKIVAKFALYTVNKCLFFS